MKQERSDQYIETLRAFGLDYPGAHIKSPWPNHEDLAVRDKTFCYLPPKGEPFSISCKLPLSCDAMLALPFTQPTGYGLGRSGWVSASFEEHEPPPIEFFKDWLDESYRAQAPKRLIAELDARSTPTGTTAARKKATTKAAAQTKKKTKKKTKTTTKKTTTKKTTTKQTTTKKTATKKTTTKKKTAATPTPRPLGSKAGALP